MAVLIRKIRKAKWPGSTDLARLGNDDIQADVLGDLKTVGSTLSVYEVDDDPSALERALVALAANCDVISNFDYVKMDLNVVQALSITIVPSPGDTADEFVNGQHRDLSQLSLYKLLTLTYLICVSQKERKPERAMTQLIAKGLEANHLNRERIKLKPDQLAKADNLNRS